MTMYIYGGTHDVVSSTVGETLGTAVVVTHPQTLPLCSALPITI